MGNRRCRTTWMLAGALALAACGGGDDAGAAATTAAPDPTSAATSAPTAATTTDPAPDDDPLPPTTEPPANTATTEPAPTTTTIPVPPVLAADDAPAGTALVEALSNLDPLSLVTLGADARAVLDEHEVLTSDVAVYAPPAAIERGALPGPDQTVVVSAALTFTDADAAGSAFGELWDLFAGGILGETLSAEIPLPGDEAEAASLGPVTALVWRNAATVNLMTLTGPDVDTLATQLPGRVGS